MQSLYDRPPLHPPRTSERTTRPMDERTAEHSGQIDRVHKSANFISSISSRSQGESRQIQANPGGKLAPINGIKPVEGVVAGG